MKNTPEKRTYRVKLLCAQFYDAAVLPLRVMAASIGFAMDKNKSKADREVGLLLGSSLALTCMLSLAFSAPSMYILPTLAMNVFAKIVGGE